MATLHIYCMYDMQHKTQNIMNVVADQCIFYGDIDGLENWLDVNEGRYIEELR